MCSPTARTWGRVRANIYQTWTLNNPHIWLQNESYSKKELLLAFNQKKKQTAKTIGDLPKPKI